jgi:hypothetical protein
MKKEGEWKKNCEYGSQERLAVSSTSEALHQSNSYWVVISEQTRGLHRPTPSFLLQTPGGFVNGFF